MVDDNIGSNWGQCIASNGLRTCILVPSIRWAWSHFIQIHEKGKKKSSKNLNHYWYVQWIIDIYSG